MLLIWQHCTWAKHCNVHHSPNRILTSIVVCGMLLLLYTVWLLLLLSALGPHTTCRQPSWAWQKLRCVGAAPCRCGDWCKQGCSTKQRRQARRVTTVASLEVRHLERCNVVECV
jgi:hypothetical protein